MEVFDMNSPCAIEHFFPEDDEDDLNTIPPNRFARKVDDDDETVYLFVDCG